MKSVLALTLLGVASALVIPQHVLEQQRGIPAHAQKLTGEALRNYVNSVQSHWKAGEPVISKESVQRKLMHLKYTAPHKDEAIKVTAEADSIPDTFDARTQWPSCVSINNIRDQSDCGSCWAFAAAEAISDRLCIHSNGTVNTLISAEDLLSCCSTCGYGCDGGYPIKAWKYFVSSGLVTGGAYETQFGCKPYSIPPCSETIGNVTWPDCPEDEYSTPKCVSKCTSSLNYPVAYKQDKHYGVSAYAVGKTVAALQTEILNNGPIEVAFTVYEDFYQYTSGVYHHTAGEALGGHAVKILGWGTDSTTNTPYWLVANSWNVAWGEAGYFKIRRGHNECGIEHAAVAGITKE